MAKLELLLIINCGVWSSLELELGFWNGISHANESAKLIVFCLLTWLTSLMLSAFGFYWPFSVS